MVIVDRKEEKKDISVFAQNNRSLYRTSFTIAQQASEIPYIHAKYKLRGYEIQLIKENPDKTFYISAIKHVSKSKAFPIIEHEEK